MLGINAVGRPNASRAQLDRNVTTVWRIRLLRRWFVDRESATRFLTPYMLVLGFTESEILSNPVLLTLAMFLGIALDAKRLVRVRAGPVQ